MNRIRTIIIDDEKYACERLKSLLGSFSQINVIDSFTNSRQGLDCILKHKPDLLFLDVELENNQSAFDLINKLDRNLYRPYIILVTAYPQYSIEAIKNEVFDYIIKPVDIDELKVLVDRLLQHMSMKTNQMLNKFDMLSK
jgi:two-component system LytT family response regulator